MAFTYFFRDLQTLEMIRDHALPSLLTKRFIDVWDAGCAMGPEPYSLAMVIRENVGHMIFRNIRICATDIDNSNLFGKMIEEGIYHESQVKRIPRTIFNKYFVSMEEPKHFRINEEIRKCVSYQKHDLLTLKPIKKGFGLIMCKNVLLHFKEEARIEVVKMFYNALDDGGYFVTEQTQKLPQELRGNFEQVVSYAQVYRKVECSS